MCSLGQRYPNSPSFLLSSLLTDQQERQGSHYFIVASIFSSIFKKHCSLLLVLSFSVNLEFLRAHLRKRNDQKWINLIEVKSRKVEHMYETEFC
ncbi:hypothetical protein F8M41_010944 [Gigaspora margarita]|uniref:Uncharacterized protein n=1 Tax=Gigaspora margarita TaxID=4874 RepID=A0A8H3X1U4_GIGMA|nr:hypothetical protein F8M41_010944 [Gigaspora margarita]